MRKIFLSLIVIGLIIPICTSAQSYSRDTSFHPLEYMDSIYLDDDPFVWNILELDDGRLFCAGIIGDPWFMTPSLVLMSQEGVRDYSFDFLGHGIVYYHIFKAKADTLLIVGPGSLQKWDFNGNWVNMDWETNMNQDLESHNWKSIHFYEDESFIAAGWSNLDSFPALYELIKIKPDGHLDTSFVIDAVQGYDQSVHNLFRYNEDQFLISGYFDSCLNYTIKNICRINIADASIDTSFHSIFKGGAIVPEIILPDGKVIIKGRFEFGPDAIYSNLIRINPDGSLDSTFNNFNGPAGASNTNVIKVCPTSDGGYLVGGIFKTYQGYPRGNIAKIDANGFLDTTVLNGAGFDTVGYNPAYSPGCVYEIIPAQNNKYYVGGQFNRFNGEEVKPIVRIFGEVDDAIHEVVSKPLQLYPNPAKEKLVINTESKIKTIEIYNLAGVLVHQQTANAKSLAVDVSALPPGNYLLRASGQEEVWVEKFVVMR